MKHVCYLLVAVAFLSEARAQEVKRNIPYADKAGERQVLDVHSPKDAKDLPVVFWIHGGGWQTGDKTDVQIKPQAFMDKGFVFVSTNYRLLPSVDMETIVRDVARSIRWVHDHVAEHGGDPKRLLIMGHSAGAQLAALICTDDRYLKAEGLSLAITKACVPVDGDTYDVPAIIETAEARWRAHGLPRAKFGHREKFGNDPAKHRDFSAVTHVAKDKAIPPFFILHVAGHPDVTAQAQRLGNVLKDAGLSATVFAARETTHSKINADLGKPDDPATKALFEFLEKALKAGEVRAPGGAEVHAQLSKALTLHASFDKGLDADFARGDKACYIQQRQALVAATPNEDVKLAADAGRFGGALHFPRKGAYRPAFKDGGVLGYNAKSWSASVSVWLRLNPDKDLEPGYCDPIQIIGDDTKKGFIFLEWSKDETPRYFRYAIRPVFHIWNPNNVAWDSIPFDKRPMVQVARAPFAREQWTHVVFTLENINDKSKPPRSPSGKLYLNGKLQGVIEKWDLTLDWDPAKVLLVLGAAYVGHMDDLAVFDRSLTDAEVERVYGLKNGIRDLRP